MSKKCVPGVICFEYITIIFIVIILFLIFMFLNNNKINTYTITSNKKEPSTLSLNPSYGISNIYNDVLMNPYQPPTKDSIPGMRTQGYNSEYRQIGILTRQNGSETILPLMGMPIHVARDKWNFYTMKDSNNMIKLPLIYKGKNCTNEYGCDNLYNGDNVKVEGYNDTFKVTMYENQVVRYIPSI